MSTESIGAEGRPGVDWGRAEFVLTGLAFLGFLALPIRLTTVYSGLPAHPLFVHVPVILIPCSVIAAIVFMARPEWFSRYAIALSLVSIVAMSSLFLTLQSGAALRGALNLQGQAENLISQHSQAAHILAILYVLFTATVIVTFAAQRIRRRHADGRRDRRPPALPPSVFAALRVALVVLSIGSAVMVFRTGDLGAKAVWQGRLQASHGLGQAGPGFPGQPQGTGAP